MIRTTAAVTTRQELTKAEAKALTDRIRHHIDAAWADITRAYEGKAWKPLGYASWEAYVKAEFDMSRRRSYQLIDQGRVIGAIAEAAGKSVHHGTQINERTAREIKDDLPAVTAEIRGRVEQGEDPEKAVVETVEAKRAEKERERKERKAKQTELDAQRQQNADKLPDSVKAQQQAKADAIAARKTTGLSDAERIAELEEAIRILESENSDLKAELKLFSEMKAEWERGGFEEVIRGKDEVIRVQASRIEAESAEKVANLRRADYFLKILNDRYNHFKDAVIDINTGEVEYV